MPPTSKASYKRHAYSGSRKSLKRVRAGLRQFYDEDSRVKIWRSGEQSKKKENPQNQEIVLDNSIMLEKITSPNEENATSVKMVEELQECRACLRVLGDKKSSCNVYQAWSIPWEGMEATIAANLAKLAHIEISKTDTFSKTICELCYKNLLDTAKFAAQVRHSDFILRQRIQGDKNIVGSVLNYSTEVWPKPIQADKDTEERLSEDEDNGNQSNYVETESRNNMTIEPEELIEAPPMNIDDTVLVDPLNSENLQMEVEIKEEILSVDEDNGNQSNYVETELSNNITIEPDELIDAPPMNIDGTILEDPLNSENTQIEYNNITYGTFEKYQEKQYLQPEIKEEPQRGEGQEIELPPYLTLDYLFCTKTFHNVTGLKVYRRKK